MKCSRCGSEWIVGASFYVKVEFCPFCKAPLRPRDSSLKETLRWIVQVRGIEVFKNGNIINSILNDLARDDEKGRKKIKTALTAGAGGEFYRILYRQGIFCEVGRKQFLSALSDCGFSEDFCDFVVDIFAYSIENESAALEKEKIDTKTESIAASKSDNDKARQVGNKAYTTGCEEGHCTQHNKDGSVTESSKKNGKWNGNFKKTYKSGEYYEGVYVDGVITGELTYVDSNGCSTVGIWEYGNWNGACKKTNQDGSVTVGTRKNGAWDGHFKKTYRDGSYWEGKYISGKISCKLTHVNSKGYAIVGIWENDNWNGKCRVENDDNSVIEGTRIDGIWNGSFKTYKHGVSCEGTYVNGDVEGEIIYTDENGNVFCCEWYNGNWNGYGEYKSKYGVLKGRWVEGELQGIGIYKYNNGRVYEGEIANFKRNGKGIIIFSTHDVILNATFKDDDVVGNATIQFPNGDVYVGTWREMIEGYGSFNGKNCLGIREITYSGIWKDGMLSGSGKLTVIPVKGASVAYDGYFTLGKISGEGYLYSVDANGTKEPITNGKWKDNKIVSGSKSRMIKDGEKLLALAVDYIRDTTVVVGGLVEVKY